MPVGSGGTPKPHHRGLYDDEVVELQSRFSEPISVAGTEEHPGVGKSVFDEVRRSPTAPRIRRPTSGHALALSGRSVEVTKFFLV